MDSLRQDREGVKQNIRSSLGNVTSDSSYGPNGQNPPEVDSKPFYICNDAGRAKQFVDRYGKDIRFVPEQGCWFVWNGKRWQVDTNGAIERLALRISTDVFGFAMNMSAKDEASRNAAIKEALKCGDRRNIQNYLSLARVDQRTILPNSSLIPKPWLVAAKNGIVDLRTGEIREYSRRDFVLHTLGCEVDRNADCPRWKQFMREVLPHLEVRRFVQKAVGYSLTGLATERMFLFLFGTGKNGKSTFVKVISKLAGGYALKAGYRLFYSTAYHPIPQDEIAELFSRRIVFASETKKRAKLNEEFMKDVTGGEELHARHLYKRGFNFQPQVVPWISGNHKPAISGTDEGIWDRVRLIPFDQTFVLGKNRDPDLALKLFAELPGILNWAIEGALLWRREGLAMPWKIRHAVAEYRTEEDALADFISEHIVEWGIGVPHSDVFDAYFKWAAKANIRYTMTNKNLAKKLRERGWKEKRTGEHKVFWSGLGLKSAK